MQLAIPLVGAGLGWAVGSTALAAQVGWMAGSIIYSYLNQPEATHGPKIEDLSMSGSSYGQPVPRGWGTFPVAGTYIWAPDLVEVAEEESGGKGGGSDYISYAYYASFAVLLCEGEVGSVRRIWFDTELVYDVSDTVDGLTKKAGLNIAIYNGDGLQEPNPTMEAIEGAGNVPAHRNLCYIVVDTLRLETYGNRRPNVRAEIVKDGTPTNPETVNTNDYGDSSWQVSYSPYTGSLYVNEMYDDLESSLIHRVDPVTLETISTFNIWQGDLRGYETNFIPDAWSHYGWANDDDPDGSHWRMMRIDLYTGETQRGTVRTTDTLNPMYGQHSFAAGTIFPMRNWIVSVNQFGVLTDGIWVWPRSLDGTNNPHLIKEITGGTDWCAEDDDGNIWVLQSDPENRITIVDSDGQTTRAVFNLASALVEVSAPSMMAWNVPTQSMMLIATVSSVEPRIIRVTYDGASTLTEEARNSTTPFEAFSRTWQHWVHDTILVGTDGAFGITQLEAGSLEVYSSAVNLAASSFGSFGFADNMHALFYRRAGHPNVLTRAMIDRIPPNSQSLQTVVTELATTLPPAQIDVTGLVGSVRGFVMSNPEREREALRRLMSSHKFGAVESDGKIKFISLGGANILTIPEDELAAHAVGTNTPAQTKIMRRQEVDFPKRIEVTALSFEREYEPVSQGAGRQITPSNGVHKVTLVEVMTDDEIAQLAEVLLNTPRAERNQHEFALGTKHLYLDPMDNITITKGAATHKIRLTEYDWKTPNIFNAKAVSTDVASFSSLATGTNEVFSSSGVPDLRTALPLIMDIPLLNDADDTAGFYAAAVSDGGVWNAAVLLRTISQSGTGFTELAGFTTEATSGLVTTVLASTSNTATWDNDSTLEVTALNGTLSTITDTDVLNGLNAIALIPSGEIIQFANVSTTTDGYRLSRLLRARKGTEHAVGSHTNGERWVMLNATAVQRIDTNVATAGIEYYYRAVPPLYNAFDAPAFSFTNNHTRLKPYSPVHPVVTYAGGDVTISWTRRTRPSIESEHKTTPLGETTESYSVEILAAGGSTVVRTVAAASATVVYASAEIVTDFGSVPATFDVNVFQISATIGRGFPLSFNTSIYAEPFA